MDRKFIMSFWFSNYCVCDIFHLKDIHITETDRVRDVFKLLFLNYHFRNLRRALGFILEWYHLFLLSFLSTKDYIIPYKSIIFSENGFKMLISYLPPILLCNSISKPNILWMNYFTKWKHCHIKLLFYGH